MLLKLPFDTGKEVSEIACGNNHCAVVAGTMGHVYCWGKSKEGQCGVVRDTVISPQLVIIQDLSTEVCEHGVPAKSRPVLTCQVDCGKLHTLALSAGMIFQLWLNCNICYWVVR